MSVEVNGWAVLLAAVSSMVVGSLWYMPATFGNTWQKLAKVDARKMRDAQSGGQMAWMYLSVFVASIVTAYVLAHVAWLAHTFFAGTFLSDTLQTAFWLWLGFTAARVYVHDTFEGRRKKLTLLNAVHELVTVLVMALIIGAWKP